MFACKIWKLRATDIMQGVVFGIGVNKNKEDKRLFTRLDIDQAFGTVINRFCSQAVISHPITIYGSGFQMKSIIPIMDSMHCITLAIENPPDRGEYRVFNQFKRLCTVRDLALKIQGVSAKLGLDVNIVQIENPRVEQEMHYYNPERQNLRALGYNPANDIDSEIRAILLYLLKYSGRIKAKRNVIIPNVWWNGKRTKSRLIKPHN